MNFFNYILTKYLPKYTYLSFNRTYKISSKNYLVVSKDLHEIIIGLLLGDLSAERPNNNCNTRLQFKQSYINEKYIFHLYSLYKNYCGSKPLKMSKFDSRVNKNKIYYSIKFQTLSLPCFNMYRELFYNLEGKKVIPANIKELLTPKGLAYWFMDDGYKSKKGLYICTESFSLSEIKTLIIVLKDKFNIECSYHSVTNGYRIYIFSTSAIDFKELVKPYLIEDFYYKLH